jgi:methyl-accepting chemotaxis protein
VATAWEQQALEALTETCRAARGDGGPVVITVAFIATGARGAVHLSGAGGPSGMPPPTLEALCQALEARGAHVVWAGAVAGAELPTGDGVQVEPRPGFKARVDLKAAGTPPQLGHVHVAQTLKAAQSIAEEAVLAIGEEMRRIYGLAETNAEGLRVVAEQFSEPTAGNADTVAATIEVLSRQVQGFGAQLLERTGRQARDIEQARVWTKDIVRLGQAIADIASSARILTFNARVESARIGDAGKGFAVIAQAIQDLATQIRSTNEAVANLAESLAEALPRLGAEAQGVATDSREQLAKLDEQLGEVQQHLATARGQAREALGVSGDRAEELKRKANAVIEHLQFQDRESQMLAEATDQLQRVLAWAGVDESQVSRQVLDQVGELGRKLEGASALRESGSVELF